MTICDILPSLPTTNIVQYLPSLPSRSLGLYMKFRVERLRTKMKLASRVKPKRIRILPFNPTLDKDLTHDLTSAPHLELHHLADHLVCV